MERAQRCEQLQAQSTATGSVPGGLRNATAQRCARRRTAAGHERVARIAARVLRNKWSADRLGRTGGTQWTRWQQHARPAEMVLCSHKKWCWVLRVQELARTGASTTAGRGLRGMQRSAGGRGRSTRKQAKAAEGCSSVFTFTRRRRSEPDVERFQHIQWWKGGGVEGARHAVGRVSRGWRQDKGWA